jgi:hypothetical protein
MVVLNRAADVDTKFLAEEQMFSNIAINRRFGSFKG